MCLAASSAISALPILVWAQAPSMRLDPSKLTYDIAAIHADSPTRMGGATSVQWRDTSYEASHVTVKEMLREAYGVEDVQIQNDPKWMDSQAFTVEAKVDATTAALMKGLNEAELSLGREHMLQALLADRFHLVLRSSIKQLPVYEITYANAVSGLRKASASSQYEDGAKWGDGSPLGPHEVSYEFISGHIKMKGQGASLDQFVARLNQKLSSQLGRTFINDTNLAGNFDFDLSFTVPWRTSFGPMASSSTGGGFDEDSTDLSLFSALKEQLGLTVKSTTGPVHAMWIESVEQPTAN